MTWLCHLPGKVCSAVDGSQGEAKLSLNPGWSDHSPEERVVGGEEEME